MLDFTATKQALVGKEDDALAAIGVPWPSGKRTGHIRCPFPNHDDKDPSWRWDRNKARAFCTCLPGSADIVDVAQRVKHIPNPADALKWLCEALGTELVQQDKRRSRRSTPPASRAAMPAAAPRPDTRGTAQGPRIGPATSPPLSQSDDSLPLRYLASRLRLPLSVAATVLPDLSAVAVGWSRHDQRRKGEGDWTTIYSGPCVVFRTRLPGRAEPVSAWQIYTAPDGTDKLRDAAEGVKVKGGILNHIPSVVPFGSPEEAPCWLITEGVEDAAFAWSALHLAAPDRSQSIAVLAGLAGSHLQRILPLPHVRLVRFAADRNEGRAPTDAGFKAGLRYARQAAVAAIAARSDGESLEASIVLPGTPGTETDFLDTFIESLPPHSVQEVLALTGPAADAWMGTWRTCAASAVSAFLDGTGTASLSEDDVDADEAGGRPTVDLAELRTVLPPPPGYRLGLLASVPWLFPIGEDLPKPICTALSCVGWLRRTDGGDYGLLLRVREPTGVLRDVAIWGERLAPHMINTVIADLRKAGLVSADQDALKSMLFRLHPDPSMATEVVPNPGWHLLNRDGRPRLIHVGLDGMIIGDPDARVILAAEMRLPTHLVTQGTLAEWQDLVLDAIDLDEQIYAPHWLLGILLGLGGDLIALSQPLSAGVVIVGVSSSGKSITLRLAAGVWSWPSELAGRGAYRTLSQTANNIENVAAAASGITLALDETALANPRDLSKMLYKLAAGAGGGRMNADSSERHSKNWQALIVTSSERSIQTMVEETGQTYQEGARARFVEVGVEDCGVGDETAVKQFENRTMQVYGVAGPAFLRILSNEGYLRDNGSELRKLVHEAAANISVDAPPVLRRASHVFAAAQVAGEIAMKHGLLPASFPLASVISWAWQSACAGVESLSPAARALSKLEEYISRRWNTSIVPLNVPVTRHAPVDGWYDDERVYLPTTVAQEAAGNALPAKSLSKALREAGWIDDEPEGKVGGDRRRASASRKPGGGSWYRAEGEPRCRVLELRRASIWPAGIMPGADGEAKEAS